MVSLFFNQRTQLIHAFSFFSFHISWDGIANKRVPGGLGNFLAGVTLKVEAVLVRPASGIGP